MFGVGNRLLCLQAHPDFNQAIGEEINAAEYLSVNLIDFQQYQYNWFYAGTLVGRGGVMRETRNMMHAIIRNFLQM